MLRALLLLLLCLPAPLRADPPPAIHCSEGRWGPRHCIRADRFVADLCGQIEAEARLHGLPPGFLARLLWQESRFDPNAVSPMRARGIAQFIDSTAALRGLRDSLNPAEAIEKSAEYLGELARRYGSLGMAAIAYNGGEARADGWAARTGGLAGETVAYVRIVTGLPAEAWRDAPPAEIDLRLDGDTPFAQACAALAEGRRTSPLRSAPSVSPWGVQVGFGRSEAAARASYGRLQAACRAAAPEERLELIPVRSRAQGRPGDVLARLGAADRREASETCARIRRAGCICAVFRN